MSSDSFSAFGGQQVSLVTPSGRRVTIGENYLGAVVDIIEDARARTIEEIVELLDREVQKMKDRGDLTSAEVVEVVRAKVKAKQ